MKSEIETIRNLRNGLEDLMAVFKRNSPKFDRTVVSIQELLDDNPALGEGPLQPKQENLEKQIKRLRDALGIIVRNVKAGVVFSSWCGKFAEEVLDNKWMPICPKCGSPLYDRIETPASDHPELTTTWKACTVCDWRENDERPIPSNADPTSGPVPEKTAAMVEGLENKNCVECNKLLHRKVCDKFDDGGDARNWYCVKCGHSYVCHEEGKEHHEY